jgi:hypothetical protein
MVGVRQWVARPAVQKSLPEKARVDERVYWRQIVNSAIDDMVSRELGGCQDRTTMRRGQNQNVLSHVSAAGATRGVVRKTAPGDDSPKTTGEVEDDVVSRYPLNVVLATFEMVWVFATQLFIDGLGTRHFDIVQRIGQFVDVHPRIAACRCGAIDETYLKRSFDGAIETSTNVDFAWRRAVRSDGNSLHAFVPARCFFAML